MEWTADEAEVVSSSGGGSLVERLSAVTSESAAEGRSVRPSNEMMGARKPPRAQSKAAGWVLPEAARERRRSAGTVAGIEETARMYEAGIEGFVGGVDWTERRRRAGEKGTWERRDR